MKLRPFCKKVARTFSIKTYQIIIINKCLEWNLQLIKGCEVWITKTYKYITVREEFYRKFPNEKSTYKYTVNIKQNLPITFWQRFNLWNITNTYLNVLYYHWTPTFTAFRKQSAFVSRCKRCSHTMEKGQVHISDISHTTDLSIRGYMCMDCSVKVVKLQQS